MPLSPRALCSHCERSIAANADGCLRSHFCPHRVPCEPARCARCTEARAGSAAIDDAPPLAMTAEAKN